MAPGYGTRAQVAKGEHQNLASSCLEPSQNIAETGWVPAGIPPPPHPINIDACHVIAILLIYVWHRATGAVRLLAHRTAVALWVLIFL